MFPFTWNTLSQTGQISLKMYMGILLISVEKIQFWLKLEEVTYNLLEHLTYLYEGWNFNSGNYLFTNDTK